MIAILTAINKSTLLFVTNAGKAYCKVCIGGVYWRCIKFGINRFSY